MTKPRLPDLLRRAREGGYAVPAFNIFDAVGMRAVLRAAEHARSPVIVQVSPHVASHWGPRFLASSFDALADGIEDLAVLHLDHCADLELIEACLQAGFASVMFDGSSLPVEENTRRTSDVAEIAHRYGAGVEAELEAIRGTEEGVSRENAATLPVEESIRFIRSTGIDCFAPSIGNVHGAEGQVRLDRHRLRQIASAVPIPMALHGGSGLMPEELAAAISLGCAKVNFSTDLRRRYHDTLRTERKTQGLELLQAIERAVSGYAETVMVALGSAGRA